jgi:hypothetical protein
MSKERIASIFMIGASSKRAVLAACLPQLQLDPEDGRIMSLQNVFEFLSE